MPLGTVGANGRFKLHSLLSLVMYPKRVCVAFLMLRAKYWGGGGATVGIPDQWFSHRLDSIVLNYPSSAI
jgi:hypothetical protein